MIRTNKILLSLILLLAFSFGFYSYEISYKSQLEYLNHNDLEKSIPIWHYKAQGDPFVFFIKTNDVQQSLPIIISNFSKYIIRKLFFLQPKRMCSIVIANSYAPKTFTIPLYLKVHTILI